MEGLYDVYFDSVQGEISVFSSEDKTRKNGNCLFTGSLTEAYKNALDGDPGYDYKPSRESMRKYLSETEAL